MSLADLTQGHPIMKMHGCGNDFVVFLDPGGNFDPGTSRAWVQAICDRHTGVGSVDDTGIVRVSSNGLEGLIYLGMGNPHAVAFTDDPGSMVGRFGPLIGQDTSVFPQGANVEFLRVDGVGEMTMRVWERGVGETLACGSGACASVVAATVDGRCAGSATVHLPGGDVRVEWGGRGKSVYLTGPARNVFEISAESIDVYLADPG